MRLAFVAIVLTAMAAQAAETRLSWSVAGEFCGTPKWSPGGKQVVCSDGAIYEAGRRVTKIPGANSPFWSPDGTRIGTVAKDDVFGVIVWDARTGKRLGAIPAPNAEEAAWAPDGKSILFSGFFMTSSIAAADALDLWTEPRIEALLRKCSLFDRECFLKEVPPPRRITDGFRPVISRDGHMAYLVYSDQYNELWVRRAGRHFSEKMPGTTAVMRLAWSPDGRWLAVTVGCDGRSCVDVVDLRRRGHGSRRLAHAVREFAWSPDSAHLAILRDIGNRKRPGIDLDRLEVARVAIADGATETLLEPKGEWCTYQALAWAPGGLLVTHRCFPEGTSGAGDNELQVYEVR